MIAIVTGEIALIEGDTLVVQVGGVGLRVAVPASLVVSLHTGDQVLLHTHLVVREDALTLYGFQTVDERSYFEMLLSVTGVGPRTALAILSALSPDAIRRSVLNDEEAVFSRVPGIGKKTAHNILFNLKDKVERLPGAPGELLPAGLDTDLLAALTSLGYSVIEAQAAMQSLPRDAPEDIEERLRLALQYFAR